jgi:hypothetical protein
MSLKVIGSGMGRTGTTSLKQALEELGYGKCYHMIELFQHPEGLHYFEEAEKGMDVNWDGLLEGYSSAVDYPIARYYKKLVAKYPQAKVIHTQRDPDAWYQSCMETIFWASKPSAGRILKMMLGLPFSPLLRKRLPVLKYNGKLIESEFGKDINDKAAVIKRYNLHNEEVLRVVPKERLLLFNVKEGWAPLCNFLNVTIPATPFPKSNTREEFIANVGKMGSRKELV